MASGSVTLLNSFISSSSQQLSGAIFYEIHLGERVQPSKNTDSKNKRIWRNRQTRWLQVPVGATRCRFNSCYPHHKNQGFSNKIGKPFSYLSSRASYFFTFRLNINCHTTTPVSIHSEFNIEGFIVVLMNLNLVYKHSEMCVAYYSLINYPLNNL